MPSPEQGTRAGRCRGHQPRFQVTAAGLAGGTDGECPSSATGLSKPGAARGVVTGAAAGGHVLGPKLGANLALIAAGTACGARRGCCGLAPRSARGAPRWALGMARAGGERGLGALQQHKAGPCTSASMSPFSAARRSVPASPRRSDGREPRTDAVQPAGKTRSSIPAVSQRAPGRDSRPWDPAALQQLGAVSGRDAPRRCRRALAGAAALPGPGLSRHHPGAPAAGAERPRTTSPSFGRTADATLGETLRPPPGPVAPRTEPRLRRCSSRPRVLFPPRLGGSGGCRSWRGRAARAPRSQTKARSEAAQRSPAAARRGAGGGGNARVGPGRHGQVSSGGGGGAAGSWLSSTVTGTGRVKGGGAAWPCRAAGPSVRLRPPRGSGRTPAPLPVPGPGGREATSSFPAALLSRAGGLAGRSGTQ